MSKEKKYYGITFNQDIPETDKINQYHKKVVIEFEGTAYLIQKNEEDKYDFVQEKGNWYVCSDGSEGEYFDKKKRCIL